MVHPSHLRGFVLFVALAACHSPVPGPSTATADVPVAVPQPAAAPLGESAPFARVPGEDEPIQPLPSVAELAEELELTVTPARVALGRQLFHDVRLSLNLTVSCASCHDLRFAGIDRAPRAIGIHQQVGPVNTPTVFNAALGIAQFWDGRAKDLASQASGPPQAPGEMGSNFPEIVARLRADAECVASFCRAYPEEVKSAADLTTERILEAIATFEATLLTPDSRFDLWLGGRHDALNEQELRGYALFKDVGCAQCHYGPAVGGKTFQKLGQK